MNLLEIFGNSFLVGLSGAMIPGPLLVVALARTPTYGAKTGPMLVIGHAIVEIFTVALLSFGLAALVNQEPIIARVIAVVGGVALLLMTAMMFAELRKGIKAPEINNTATKLPPLTRESSLKLIREGMIATISNPYWFVWWGAIGSALVVASLQAGKLGPPVFFVGHILSDFSWYALISILLWQGKNLFTGKRFQLLIGLCAAFLLWLGLWFIYSGINGAIELS